ncbi:hypothetical protein GQ44DRAFT_674905 [Phaeosphaeriaceae sp. PMI808]|nr:hypothetical protein GQ44DRAFT_674905 [Phaeosphaeriaceae sp. PMI808]
MPPHLHPRSRMTTSLFTTTLMISFLVVAAPHLLPCPVDPRTFADSADPTSEARRARRREKLAPKRECPVPKPGGLMGQVLGWKEDSDKAKRDAQSNNKDKQ